MLFASRDRSDPEISAIFGSKPLAVWINHREVAHSSHAEMLPGTVCLAHVPPKSQGGPVWQLEVIREKIHGCL
jgi:hypothetical protein